MSMIHYTPPSDLPIVYEPTAPDQHPAVVYLASLAKGSQRTMQDALNTIAAIIGFEPLFDESGQALRGKDDRRYLLVNWGALRYQHTMAIRARLQEGYTPPNTDTPLTAATANKILSALRQVLKHAWRLGLMGAEEYQRAVDVQNITGETVPAGRDLGSGEIADLSRVCASDPTPAGARDAAIIGLMVVTGIRRASVVKLDLADYDPNTGRLMIRGAKRNKTYTAFVTNGSKTALDDWLAVRGNEPGALFWPVNSGGKTTPRRMTTQAVYNMLVKRAEQAGLSHFSPHDFRRTLAGDLLDAGADIVTVQKLLGHANVNTTARYDRRPEDAKRKAAELVHFPYFGRNQKRMKGV